MEVFFFWNLNQTSVFNFIPNKLIVWYVVSSPLSRVLPSANLLVIALTSAVLAYIYAWNTENVWHFLTCIIFHIFCRNLHNRIVFCCCGRNCYFAWAIVILLNSCILNLFSINQDLDVIFWNFVWRAQFWKISLTWRNPFSRMWGNSCCNPNFNIESSLRTSALPTFEGSGEISYMCSHRGHSLPYSPHHWYAIRGVPSSK